MPAPTLLDGTTYTRAEMFEVLKERGLTPPNQRTFSDWIERGIIDRAVSRPGAGQGKGSKGGRWPGTQVELLATMVAKRQEAGEFRSAIGALANIPVFLWLGWGEEYAPIRQVRRAVGTWAEGYQQNRGQIGKAASETARLARKVKAPGVRQADVTRYGKALADFTISKSVDAAAELFDLGDKVIDPDNVGRVFGAPGASLDAETMVVAAVVLQRASQWAAKDLRADLRGSSKFWFSDDHYHQVRQRWHQTHYEYQHMQPLLKVAGPADMYQPLTADDLVNNACRTVLNLMALVDPRTPRPWLERR